MSGGPPLDESNLTMQENSQLVAWPRLRKTSQALALRSRVVLARGPAADNSEVARRCRVTRQTVGEVCGRTMDRTSNSRGSVLHPLVRPRETWRRFHHRASLR